MGECNTILSAFTMYRDSEWCCTHPSTRRKRNECGSETEF